MTAKRQQAKAAELMEGQNNYFVQFAEALLAATPDIHWPPPGRKSARGAAQVSTEQTARMERKVASLQAQVKSFEETFGIDTRHHTVARGTIPDAFRRVKLGENFYDSVKALQLDLDAWLIHYNNERPHLGYRNVGRRPIETVMSIVSEEG